MNYQGYINTSHFSSNIGKQMPSATENLWLAMPCNLHQAPKKHKKPTKGSTMCARRSPRAAFTRLLFSQTLRWLRLRVSNNNSINMFSNVDPFQQQKGIVQLTQLTRANSRTESFPLRWTPTERTHTHTHTHRPVKRHTQMSKIHYLLTKICERHFLCCLVGGQLWIPKKVVTNAFADVCKASFHLTSISKPNWTGVDGAPSGETLARAIGTNLANSTGHIDSHLLSFLGSGRKAEYTFLIS